MGRLIVLILLVVVAIWLLRRAIGRRGPGRNDSGGHSPREMSADAGAGQLVRCSHCGMYVPEREAKRAGGLAFCTEDHARLGPRKP